MTMTAKGEKVATRRSRPSKENNVRTISPKPGRGLAVALLGGSDVDIVLRMRTGNPADFERFVERFHPMLLDCARRAGIGQPERDDLVSDILTDVALHFLTPGAAAPRNPRMYLIASFRNRLLNEVRGNARRDNCIGGAVRDAAVDYADSADIAAGCSQAAVRESRGPGWESAAIPVAVRKLAIHLAEALTVEERQLLVAVAEDVPQRQVAEWLGLSHAAARKRLERLRGRMARVAVQFTGTLPPAEAHEVQKFFRRCDARIVAGEPQVGPSRDEGIDGERKERKGKSTGEAQ
jgi:DNA-directed RNA polymerase specialized sigma24 family protein